MVERKCLADETYVFARGKPESVYTEAFAKLRQAAESLNKAGKRSSTRLPAQPGPARSSHSSTSSRTPKPNAGQSQHEAHPSRNCRTPRLRFPTETTALLRAVHRPARREVTGLEGAPDDQAAGQERRAQDDRRPRA
ncbi:hypothetical protein GCM10027610_101550 [Dactylosporangium cerinum]